MLVTIGVLLVTLFALHLISDGMRSTFAIHVGKLIGNKFAFVANVLYW